MKKVTGFVPSGGAHCITNSLKQIFQFNGYTISEQTIFGTGEGISFVYVNLSYAPMMIILSLSQTGTRMIIRFILQWAI